MIDSLYLPIDEVASSPRNFDCAADYLEFTAFFSKDSTALTSDLADQVEIGAEDNHADLKEELQSGEEDLVPGTVMCIKNRCKTLGLSAYPFNLDQSGEVLTCTLDPDSVGVGHAAYILSLVLSNLRTVSPVLNGSNLHPSEQEVRQLRMFFQYFATAALASEVYGSAWSFGFPRPDGTGFLEKLRQIWQTLGDGSVESQKGAPPQPKDDQIDVFAARPHPDGLPGFLLAVAQVATGANAGQKSLKGHLDTFKRRWFDKQPVTAFLPYMIVPFAKTDDQFLDEVPEVGNLLHRLRVPRRVVEAADLVEAGKMIEGYDRLAEAMYWIADYQRRAREAA